MEEHENCLDKKRVLEKAKEFDGSIKNMEDFFEHIKMLEECENCKRVFWNKLCPDCVNKNIEFEIKEYKKRVEDTNKKGLNISMGMTIE